MLRISRVTPADLPDLLVMIGKLCTFHGDTCILGIREAQAQFTQGPLIGFIAVKNGRPAGYIVLEPHWRPTQKGNLLEIAHLFVEAPLRGCGIGKALIAQAQDHAGQVGACRLVIGTAPLNPDAATIYRAMGFDEITMQPGPRFNVPLQSGDP